MSFRLALVNPNTDEQQTATMAEAIADTLPEAHVEALTATRGPRWIETAADVAVAAAETVAMIAAHPDRDAYLVGCFSDPGLLAARELTGAPVLGVGESAYLAAGLVARRFAVITTLPRGVVDIEDALRALGWSDRCAAVLALGQSVADQDGDASAIVAAGHRAVGEHGAEALVLACGAMTAAGRAASRELGVPVVDGVTAGAQMAHALWRAGLATAQIGSLAAPEPIPYDGMAPLGPVERPAC